VEWLLTCQMCMGRSFFCRTNKVNCRFLDGVLLPVGVDTDDQNYSKGLPSSLATSSGLPCPWLACNRGLFSGSVDSAQSGFQLLHRVPCASEYRWLQVLEKLSVDPCFVCETHELYDDALCPRCTILCSIRAAQNLTETLADRIEI
jgi:hypothetical protein